MCRASGRRPPTTDADGRFRVLGLGADTPATYEVEDSRYAHQALSFQAGAQGRGTPRPGSTITRPGTEPDPQVIGSVIRRKCPDE
jgi:hypothetical protein